MKSTLLLHCPIKSNLNKKLIVHIMRSLRKFSHAIGNDMLNPLNPVFQLILKFIEINSG